MQASRILLTLALLSSPSVLRAADATAKAPAPAPSAAKLSFDQLKALAGDWEGRVTTEPRTPDIDGMTTHVTLRVTSMGNALLHEMHSEGRPDDPITMLYLDGDHLMLTHYCDAGNRPRMQAKQPGDGKTVQFELVDITGNLQYGHMHNAAFTAVDANHHTEDWTFMVGDKPVHAHFDLVRKSEPATR